MPTEDDARQLLAKAAGTIDVDGTAPLTLTGLPEPHARRRWPILAAAAAVLVAIGGGYLVAQQLGDDPAPAPEPAVDRPKAPDDRQVVLDPDQLPSVVGYTEDEAIALVQSRGYAVQVHVVPDGCNVPGIVTGTNPAVGTRMEAGDTVTIRVIGQQDVIDCVGEVPWVFVWDVVRYARGLEDLDPERQILVSEETRAAISALVSRPWPGEGSPRLVARYNSNTDPCWPQSDGVYGLRFWVEVPTDGQFCPSVSVVVEFGDDEGYSARIEGDDPAAPDPVAPTPARLESAKAFVEWARGEGSAPAFADRVRVMFGGGGAFGSTGWVNDPEERTLYSGCSGLGFPDCGVDPVALLVRYRGPVVATAGRSICADGGDVPYRFAAAAPDDAVRLEEPEPENCRTAWAVELWIDEDGVIYGVNQAGAPS